MPKLKIEHWITIGKILRPFGLKGGLKFSLENFGSNSLHKGLLVRLKTPKIGNKDINIQSLMNDGRIFFEDVTTREQAEALVNSQILIERSSLPPIAPDEVYLSDLIGAKIVSLEGKELGTIEAFSDNRAQPLAEIITMKKKRATIPFVKPLVVEIDEKKGIVLVDLPKGLID